MSLKFKTKLSPLRYCQHDQKLEIYWIFVPQGPTPSKEKQPVHVLPSTDEDMVVKVDNNMLRPRAPDSLLK